MNIRTLGRANNNSFVLKKADVSSHHARVTMLDNDLFLVEDLDSTNGVFVNGYRIKQANIKINDELRLSENTIINLADLFPKNAPTLTKVIDKKSDPKDFIEEFNGLKTVWEDYNHQKLRISTRYQNLSTVARSVLGLFPILVWVIFKLAYLDSIKEKDPQSFQDWQGSFIYFSAIGGSIAGLLGGLLIKSPQEKLNNLDEEFRVRYVCPNKTCRTQLGNIPWKSYQNQGKCFRCQAKYNKELLNA